MEKKQTILIIKAKIAQLKIVGLLTIIGLISSFIGYAAAPVAPITPQEAHQMNNFLRNLQYQLITQPVPFFYVISRPGQYLPNVVSSPYYNGPLTTHTYNNGPEEYIPETELYNNGWQAYSMPMQNLRMNTMGIIVELKNICNLAGFIDPQLTANLTDCINNNGWLGWYNYKNCTLNNNAIPLFEYFFCPNPNPYGYAYNHNLCVYPIKVPLWIYLPHQHAFFKMPATIGGFVDLIIKYYVHGGVDVIQQIVGKQPAPVIPAPVIPAPLVQPAPQPAPVAFAAAPTIVIPTLVISAPVAQPAPTAQPAVVKPVIQKEPQAVGILRGNEDRAFVGNVRFNSNNAKIGNKKITFEAGDIAAPHGDQAKKGVVVSAANAHNGLTWAYTSGDGVARAIGRAAGTQLLKDKKITGQEIKPGEVVTTEAYGLTKNGYTHIIHAVGPDCSNRNSDDYTNRKKYLELAYARSFEEASKVGAERVVLPPISLGHFTYPNIDEGAQVAIDAALNALRSSNSITEIIFVLVPNSPVYKVFSSALAKKS